MPDAERDPALDPRLDQVSRRSFLKRVSATTLAAAAGGEAALAADAPRALDDPNLVREEIIFPSGQQQIQGFLTHPRNTHRRGSVVVIHEIFGLTDHIKDVACRLAEAGFTALAPNFFTREGPPPDGFDALMPFVNQIPDSQILGDVQAAVNYLRTLPISNRKMGVLGFCWGGYYAMLSDAEVTDIDAVVAYYGRIRLAEKTASKPNSPLDLVPQMKAPLLGNFGALDRSIPPADAAALRDALQQHGKRAEIYEYEGAGHAFNNDTRESYNAPAAKLAWSRTLSWFRKYLK